MSKYDASSIRMEKGAAAHRRAVARYLGSDGVEGIQNQLFEIIDNSVDEMIRYARENRMTDYAEVKIEIKEDDTVIVEDFGNGIPCEVHPIYKEPAIYILCESDSSGGKGRGTTGYDDSDPSGVHGAGMAVSKSVTTTFELFVKSKSANGEYYLKYINGERSKEGLIRTGDLEKDSKGNVISGTKIVYHYDPTIFSNRTEDGRTRDEVYDNRAIKRRLTGIILGTQNDNLRILYKYKNEPEIEYSNKTVTIEERLFTDNYVHLFLNNEENVFKGELYIEYNPNFTQFKNTTIVNRMEMVKSTSTNSIVDAIMNEIRFRFAKDPRKKRHMKNARLVNDEFKENLNIVFIMTLHNAKYAAQTKVDLKSTEYIGSLQRQLMTYLRDNEEFVNKIYEPFIRKKEEDEIWKQKRAEEAEKRRKAEERRKEKSKAEKKINELKNNEIDYEFNKSESEITIKESPKPVKESTLVYVEGKSAGSDFNDLHKDREYPIAIAIAEGKVPNVADESNIDNPMTIDNRLYCLEAGYKDIAIFTDADADGNHIRLLHLLQIYTFAKHYLDNSKVFIIPAPYSTVQVFEYTSINLYGEVKNYAPGQHYLYSAKEHQALVNSGARTNKKFRGLADSSVSLKELLIHRENWIKIKPLTKNDADLVKRLLNPRDEYKADFTSSVFTERLYFSNTIQKMKDEIELTREDMITAVLNSKFSNTPEDVDYRTYLTRTGIYNEEEIKSKINDDFYSKHDFGEDLLDM